MIPDLTLNFTINNYLLLDIKSENDLKKAINLYLIRKYHLEKLIGLIHFGN